jgi:hypothetical protein
VGASEAGHFSGTYTVTEPGLELRSASRTTAIVGDVSVAWRWLVVGGLAIGVGLAVWWTTFILVPVGVVLVGVGVTKWVRSRRALTRR